MDSAVSVEQKCTPYFMARVFGAYTIIHAAKDKICAVEGYSQAIKHKSQLPS